MKLKTYLSLFFIIFTILIPHLYIIDAYPDYKEKRSTTSIVVGPYPQKSTINSIEILWETDTKTTRNEVHWGENPDLGNISSESLIYDILGRTLHQVRLRGLRSSTKYYYKVISYDIESDIYSFYTVFDSNDSIRFIAYGDSRGVWDNWQHAEIVAQAIEEQQPYFVLHTGDLVKNGKNKSQWIDFFSISEFVHNSTLYPSLGNHEYHAFPYFQYFSLPGNELWYSFDNGPIHFIALDSSLGMVLTVV